MTHNEVIEVLEEELESGEITLTGEFGEALVQAVSMIKENAELKAKYEALKRGIERLTPQGSEFHNNPERCFSYIRDRQKLTIKFAIKAKHAEQELSELKAKYDELEKARKVEQGAWEETYKYQEQFIAVKKELESLKKAVASEGLGVEALEEQYTKFILKGNYDSMLKQKAIVIMRDAVHSIHEAQTKYKKEKGEI